MTDSRHSDNFRRAEPAAGASAKDKPASAAKTTDNEAQAAHAEAQRERTFAMGGGAPESAGPPGSPGDAASVRPTPILDAALKRFASGQRPSPFGVPHFPPLPMPPGTK